MPRDSKCHLHLQIHEPTVDLAAHGNICSEKDEEAGDVSSPPGGDVKPGFISFSCFFSTLTFCFSPL